MSCASFTSNKSKASKAFSYSSGRSKPPSIASDPTYALKPYDSTIYTYNFVDSNYPKAQQYGVKQPEHCQKTPEEVYNMSKCGVSDSPDEIPLIGSCCDTKFTWSGSKPPKTVGPLNSCYDSFAKYAACGHWNTCREAGCEPKKYFDPCATCTNRAPYGPYGPWSKNGPAMFESLKPDYIKQLYPLRHKKMKKMRPMGKLKVYPLSGSCRYAGRPYGACRPFGAYKSRGPFGSWNCPQWPAWLRPRTPCQPCYPGPKKKGCRPCTPCHRPSFRPCKVC